jgi:hypothetical protein
LAADCFFVGFPVREFRLQAAEVEPTKLPEQMLEFLETHPKFGRQFRFAGDAA